MLAQGDDARIIMAVLGHSQISTTMDFYAHVMLGPTEMLSVTENPVAGSAGRRD